MTTLAQARKALNEAHTLNTADAWRLAALAFADASEARRKPASTALAKHTGKNPIMHVGRCILADGYSVRVSIGQFKGETIANSLARLERFTVACWKCETVSPPTAYGRNVNFGLPQQMAMNALVPPDTVELRIVKHGTGPDAGLDLECPPMLAAAE